jgi:hypothetical protein
MSPAAVPSAQSLLVKLLLCPKTWSASASPAPASPLEGFSGVLYSSTRLAPLSAT